MRVATVLKETGEVSNISIFEAIPEDVPDHVEMVEVTDSVKIGMVRGGGAGGDHKGFGWRDEQDRLRNLDRSDTGHTDNDDTVNDANQGGGAKTKQATKAAKAANQGKEDGSTNPPPNPTPTPAPAAPPPGEQEAPTSKEAAINRVKAENPGINDENAEAEAKKRYPDLFKDAANA